MAISLKNCRVKQQNHPFLANCTNSALSFHYLVKLLNILTGSLFLGSTAPFGRPSASVEFLHSISLSTRSVQDTTPEGVLSLCWCYLTLTLATSMGILDGAGATKSWFHSATLTKSFALIKQSLSSAEIFYLDAKRNAQRWQWNTNMRQKTLTLMRERVWCHEMLVSSCENMLFQSNLFDFSSTT